MQTTVLPHTLEMGCSWERAEERYFMLVIWSWTGPPCIRCSCSE